MNTCLQYITRCGLTFIYLITCCVLSFAQLSIPPSGISPTIDFDVTVPSVNIDAFSAMNAPISSPSSGDLDLNAWSITGLSDVASDYRGSSMGGVTSGGIYAFNPAGNVFLGAQPSGSDLTPGTFSLSAVNNTGSQINELNLAFELLINNDQERSTSIISAVSADGGPFVDLNTTITPEASDANGFNSIPISENYILPAPLDDGGTIEIRWTIDDEAGSGSRDEVGFDNIVLTATGFSNNCTGTAGPDYQVNEGESVELMAMAQEMGAWSSDFGSFSSSSNPNAMYTPGNVVNDTSVVLTWTSSPGESGCTETEYTANVLVRAQISADFTYDPAQICPRDGVGLPILATGAEAGVFSFSVVSGGPSLDINSETGEINAGNSDEGEYTITNMVTGCGNLIITGVVDGTLTGGEPKAVELYALTDIADLSAYNIETVNNGNGVSTNGEDLPAVSLSAGEYYYITGDAAAFQQFFGFDADLEDGEINGNGDDAIVLKCRGSITDVFGDPDVDGSTEPWVYLDGWAYRNNNQESNGGAFNSMNWSFSGINALDGAPTNVDAMNPMPIGTFMNTSPPPNTDVSSSFNITIDFDADPGISLACKGQVNATIDPTTCFADITYLMMLQNVDPLGCFNYNIDIDGLSTNLISTPGTYKVSVVSGYDGNSCWGTVTVEDKSAPIITCPLDATIACALDPTPENVRIFGMTELVGESFAEVQSADFTQGPLNAAAWGVDVQECGGFTLDFQDMLRDGECDGDTIIRTFTARDETGRVTSCSHTIFLAPEDLSDITLPDDYDCLEMQLDDCADRVEVYGTIERNFILKCDEEGSGWSALPNGNPSPDDSLDIAGNLISPGTGRIGGLNCGNVDAGFNDIRVPLCIEDTDECAQSSPSFKVVRQWKILDWCTGAIVEHNQIIKVIDDEAPIAEPFEDVTISTDLWDCSATYTLPLGEAIDNCSSEIRREYRASKGTINNGMLFVPENAKTMNGDTINIEVDFVDCCGNIATESFNLVIQDLIPPVPVADHHTTVSLSQFETDGLAKIYAESFDDGSFDNCGPIDMQVRRMTDTLNCVGYENDIDPILFRDFVHFCCEDVGEILLVEFRVCDDADMNGLFNSEGDNCNFAMIEVEVQDKLPPACSAPEDMTIDCIDLAALGDISLLTVEKINAQFGPANGAATCAVAITQVLESTEECGLGSITRTITAENISNELTSSCVQIITVEVDSNTNFLTCDDISFPANSEEQMTFSASGISNVWCETNPLNIGDPVDEGADLPAVTVMNCTDVMITAPVINIEDLCSEVGINLTLDTFNFAGGGCKKILAHWEIIDQCIFDENFVIDEKIDPFRTENGYFELYVEYNLFDTEGPVITCGEGFSAECDGSLSNTLSASADDNCTSPEFFGWSWKFDLNADGTAEHEGEGNEITPSSLELDEFPSGQHIVTWIVSDGCGNISSMECPLGFFIEDNKAPTPYCFDGLATAFMESGSVTLWAADFDAGSFDNCGEVFVTMVPERDVEDLSEALAYGMSLNQVINPTTGKEEYGWIFDCSYIPNGIAGTLDIRIYVTDEAGNFDYCTATLRLIDNLNACEDPTENFEIISGNIQTASGSMLQGVTVEVTSALPDYPKYMSTDDAGNYSLLSEEMGHDYRITPFKNDDYRNGVSTLDIVLIQKHILGISLLDGPYNIIAADVNNDNSVKATDLLQLRKLILGLYPEDRLPNSNSWRFMEKNTVFDDDSQPWVFDESVEIIDLNTPMLNQDFTAMKVGDVNGSVEAKSGPGAQVRNELSLSFLDQKVQKGNKVSVSLTLSNSAKLFGMQAELNFGENLEFIGFENGAIAIRQQHLGLSQVENGSLMLSFDDVKGIKAEQNEVLLSLSFKARQDLTLSEVLSFNDTRLNPEVYIGEDLEIYRLNLRTVVRQARQLVVHQNEPNPFKGHTTIGVEVPDDGDVRLDVYDVTGRVIHSETQFFQKGTNSFVYRSNQQIGILFYKITAGEETATRKMIVLD